MSPLKSITLAVALLPTVIIMLIVIKNARAEKEPFKKLAAVFAFSALSTIPAIILELIGGKVRARAKHGPYSRTDLGIVKYHFELASGKDRSIWV